MSKLPTEPGYYWATWVSCGLREIVKFEVGGGVFICGSDQEAVVENFRDYVGPLVDQQPVELEPKR